MCIRDRNKSWLALCNKADRVAGPDESLRKDIIPVYEFSGVGNENTFYEIGTGPLKRTRKLRKITS